MKVIKDKHDEIKMSVRSKENAKRNNDVLSWDLYTKKVFIPRNWTHLLEF